MHHSTLTRTGIIRYSTYVWGASYNAFGPTMKTVGFLLNQVRNNKEKELCAKYRGFYLALPAALCD